MASEEDEPAPALDPLRRHTAHTPSSSVIEGGAVAGSLPAAEAFAVHYPGYPSSDARAIQTLGGLDHISKVRSSESSNLELRFRPEDPCCHPAFGKPRLSSGLLLKITKTQPRPEAEQLSAEIVARVLSGYHFEGMVDFQHVLAVHAAESRSKKRHVEADAETQANEGPKKRGLLDSDAADVMMLVPPLFSHKDTQQKIVLKPPANLFSRSMHRGLVRQSWEMGIETSLAIDFNIEKVPGKVNWEDYIPKDTDEWKWQVAVCKLFDERPIWPRWSFNERLLDDGIDVNRDLLKRLLLRTGYYFSSGPFGRFWIKKGYDPRKDPEARIYQRVDFRMPPLLRNLADKNEDAGLKHTWKDICRFQVFPPKSFVCLQLFELDDDYIHQEIRKPVVRTTCLHSTGWFSNEMLQTFIYRVRMRFLSVSPNRGAESLLKSTIANFERAKQREALSRYQISEKKNHHVHKDPSDLGNVPSADHNGVCHENEDLGVPSDNDIDNGEEMEVEEEELDEFESPSEDAEEDSLLPTDGSQNCLQELLFGFPFVRNAEGQLNNNSGGVDACDDEFEIFEQDSDDNDNYSVEQDGFAGDTEQHT